MKANHELSSHEISVFVLNDRGEVLLQRRSANKKYYPNTWALCTGHVEKGESSREAAVREIKEELGISVCFSELYSFYDGKFDSSDVCFFYIKSNLADVDFVIQKEEVSEVKWFSIDKILDMIKSHDEGIVYRENKLYLFIALKEFLDGVIS